MGARNMQKALLGALLMPWDELRKAQEEGDMTYLLQLREECKTLPMGDIWDEYLKRCSVPNGKEWIAKAKAYENEVLSKRK